MKTESCKLYSRDFWIFLPNNIKIDHYNFELYHFKVGPFFWDTVYMQWNCTRDSYSCHCEWSLSLCFPSLYCWSVLDIMSR